MPRFFNTTPIIFINRDLHYEDIINNLKELIIKENIGSEIKVMDYHKNRSVAELHGILELPCMVIHNRYYYKDDLVNLDNLRRVLLKNAKS
jgi:hypothetical protein